MAFFSIRDICACDIPNSSAISIWVLPTIKRSFRIFSSLFLEEKEIFGEIVKLRSRKIGNFELYRILTRASNELNELRTEYNDIDNSNEIKKITKQIDDIDIKIDNAIEYYNDNITIYNSLLKKIS
jgi:hypothetical protein